MRKPSRAPSLSAFWSALDDLARPQVAATLQRMGWTLLEGAGQSWVAVRIGEALSHRDRIAAATHASLLEQVEARNAALNASEGEFNL
jgi:hypothetical protein